MSNALTTRIHAPFPIVVDQVTAALAGEGFGVLTQIDVQATMAAKLGEQMEPYLILGACNPPLAHQALDVDRSVGVLLPCNVVVRVDGDAVLVEAVDPDAMVALTGQVAMAPVAERARQKLAAALASIG